MNDNERDFETPRPTPAALDETSERGQSTPGEFGDFGDFGERFLTNAPSEPEAFAPTGRESRVELSGTPRSDEGGEGVDRDRAAMAIKHADELLRTWRSESAETARTWLAGGDAFVQALERALEMGCERAGIEGDAFARTIAAHPDLGALEEAMARAAISGGDQDPGPYDALSGRDEPGSQDRECGTGAHPPAPITTKSSDRAA